jgi:ankyrin repeat protein
MDHLDEELSEAAGKNNLPEVRSLLRAGANVNSKDEDGWTLDGSHPGQQ